MQSTLDTESPTEIPLREDADGVIRVGKTRVTLKTVVEAFNEGATAEEISLQYPALELAAIYAVLAYYLQHRDAVKAYLSDLSAFALKTRIENEAKFNPGGLRERLLARRKAKG